jgi:hypothetical protein
LSMLLFSDPDQRERPRIFALAAWVTALNAYMVCLNYWRYDYGILNGVPDQINHSAYGSVQSICVYGVALVLVAGCAALTWADKLQRVDEVGISERLS